MIERLNVDQARSVLDMLNTSSEIVIIDGGAIDSSAAALTWAQATSATTLVVTLGETKREAVRFADESLRLVGAGGLGSVLVRRARARGLGRTRAPAVAVGPQPGIGRADPGRSMASGPGPGMAPPPVTSLTISSVLANPGDGERRARDGTVLPDWAESERVVRARILHWLALVATPLEHWFRLVTLPGRLTAGAFWLSVGAVAASYVGLPALILARGRLVRRPVAAADIEPFLSVVVAAHDEAHSIRAKIDNVFACDYPTDRLEMVIASDGSTDATVAIAAAVGDPRLRVLDLPRVGKAEALNRAMAVVTGDVLVFSDADSLLAPDALRAIVRPFADPEVGGVAGDQRYVRGGSGGIAVGEREYWDFDRLLKRAESAAGSVVSAAGSLYAVRRELVTEITSGVTDDFYASTAVVAAGRRLVFAEDAVVYGPVAATGQIEFGRKVRVITRGLYGVVRRRALLDPRRHGFYAVQLAWHKVARRLVAISLLGVAVSAPLLWRRGPVYRLATLAQAAVYGLAAAGLTLRGSRGRSKVVALPAYFCLVNAAALVAAWNVVRGRVIDRWDPQRGADTTTGDAGPTGIVSVD